MYFTVIVPVRFLKQIQKKASAAADCRGSKIKREIWNPHFHFALYMQGSVAGNTKGLLDKIPN